MPRNTPLIVTVLALLALLALPVLVLAGCAPTVPTYGACAIDVYATKAGEMCYPDLLDACCAEIGEDYVAVGAASDGAAICFQAEE